MVGRQAPCICSVLWCLLKMYNSYLGSFQRVPVLFIFRKSFLSSSGNLFADLLSEKMSRIR